MFHEIVYGLAAEVEVPIKVAPSYASTFVTPTLSNAETAIEIVLVEKSSFFRRSDTAEHSVSIAYPELHYRCRGICTGLIRE